MLKVCLLQLAVAALASANTLPASSRQERSSECFESLGCFRNDAPFFSVYRPISVLPQSPSAIGTKFNLFTRQAPNVGHTLHAGDAAGLAATTFRPGRPTKFIVHGFIDNGGTAWMADMKNEFLKHGDYNVVLIDWGSGSMALYGQASANTRVVGALTAQLIDFLTNQTDCRPEDMHIIGHSLGAHVAGYAGERLRYLGRITGLDPAEPYFQNTDKVVRLDPSDALFVDVIHTDGASFYSTKFGLGMGEPCGHVDYFPNGGHAQPGCEAGLVTHFINEGLFTGSEEFVACNHLRSYHFFIETINSQCPFEAYQCDSEDHFNSGKCLPCSGQGCGYMGLNADRVKPAHGTTHVKYFLRTGSLGPYCRYHYKVSLTFSSGSRSHDERGQLYVELTGANGLTTDVKVTPNDTHIAPGQTYSYIMTSKVDLGTVRNVMFHWKQNADLLDFSHWNPLNLRHPTLYVDKISVVSGEGQKTFNFCMNGTPVATDIHHVFATHC